MGATGIQPPQADGGHTEGEAPQGPPEKGGPPQELTILEGPVALAAAAANFSRF